MISTAEGTLHTADLHKRFAASTPAERETMLDEAAAGLIGDPGTDSAGAELDFDDPDVFLNLRLDILHEPGREHPDARFSYVSPEYRLDGHLTVPVLYDGEDTTVLTDDDVHGDVDELYALAIDNMRMLDTDIDLVMLDGGSRRIPAFWFHAADPHVRCLIGDIPRRVAEIRSDPDHVRESFLFYVPDCKNIFVIDCEDYLMLTPDARREYHGVLMQARHCGHGLGWLCVGDDDVPWLVKAEWNDVLEEMRGHRHDDAA